jgi:hypothetical protein
MTHGYWAYAAVPGTLDADAEQAAVDEGRRAFALDMATRGSYFSTEDEAIVRARTFEAYLKGESA